ncbi:T9SS type A sorting domain-containing protein [Paraflavitalea sp. CAU 1676]|uniref:T9SS type A sorting domain-containing protein n=1 Tax=Paraflavitalea sp. CAU 1676 TaxID=3032598 RepID=UPI0023DCBD48|nr:T9SS type A sorting domain-containing protein [Paraflavitalea sp. CAU 1676]MDF2189550.1 T9SS type A sorting domain-containing protein [Paraflavitalea sp. CAU 1676]
MKQQLLAFCCCFCSGFAMAQDAGFFLNDWQPVTITAPLFNNVAKPTGTAGVSITIDAGNVINKVSKYLFGNNANPYMSQMVTEPVLIDHIKNLSPGVIRMPGGNISSVYFWNALPNTPPADVPDSLYDSDGKKVIAGWWYGKNTAGWTLSLDNYYGMLQQTGSTGIVCVNYSYARYGTGTDPVKQAAHLAADWVRYDNGRTKYWEIGNEDAGPWQAGYKIDVTKNKDGQPEIINGGLYGEHVKVFIDSMRKAATEKGATIYIGAQLIQVDAATSWNPVERNWNSTYFSKAGNAADFYIVHSYYTPFNENSTATTILNTAAAETQSMMNWMRTTTQQAGVALKPIALTEWNIFAVGSKQMVSHVSGLHATLTLGELIKNKYGQASRWDLSNAWDNGNDHGTFSAGDEPGVSKWAPRPSFYHMYYFRKYFGDQLVASSVTGHNDIVSYASTFSSGQAGVVIVNKGTSAQQVKLNFQNFNPGTRYYWYTLTGDNDNGEFSRKVLVNGTGPAGVAGGPENYVDLKANAALCENDVRISIPARSATFVLVEKSSVTGMADIDPEDKLVKVYPNPARNGNFTLHLNGFTPVESIGLRLVNSAGQSLYEANARGRQIWPMQQYLRPGTYCLQVVTAKGSTTKKIFVP